jgi:hypothetical protein
MAVCKEHYCTEHNISSTAQRIRQPDHITQLHRITTSQYVCVTGTAKVGQRSLREESSREARKGMHVHAKPGSYAYTHVHDCTYRATMSVRRRVFGDGSRMSSYLHQRAPRALRCVRDSIAVLHKHESCVHTGIKARVHTSAFTKSGH